MAVWKISGSTGGVRMAVAVGVEESVGVRVNVGVLVNIALGTSVAVAAGGRVGEAVPAQPASKSSMKSRNTGCRIVLILLLERKCIDPVIIVLIHDRHGVARNRDANMSLHHHMGYSVAAGYVI